MDPQAKVAEAILGLTLDGLNQLIEFLTAENSVAEIQEKDIRYIALMREPFWFNGKYYFGTPNTMGQSVAVVLDAAKRETLPLGTIIEMLQDTRQTLDFCSD